MKKTKVLGQKGITDKPTAVNMIAIERDRLLAAVDKFKTIVNGKVNLPVLKNCMVDFSFEGGIRIWATDLELTAIVTIPHEICFPCKGPYMLPGAILRDSLDKMKEGPLDIEFNDDKSITLRQGGFDIRFPWQDPEDYPAVDLTGPSTNREQVLTIDGDALTRGIERVIYATGKDEARFVLTGVGFRICDEELHTIGTDGFRISLYLQPAEGAEDMETIVIPKRGAKFAADNIGEKDIVSVSVVKGGNGEKKSVIFETPALILQSRLITEKYPDYQGPLHPQDDVRSYPYKVSVAYMSDALARLAVLGKLGEYPRITLKQNRIDFAAESNIAVIHDFVPVTAQESSAAVDEIPFSINAGQFIDAFKHIATPAAQIIFPNSYSMIRITDHAEGEKPRHIQGIMPMRI
jgi:DNA polymerase III sliding clamp (beta) subunit (PCNA family)